MPSIDTIVFKYPMHFILIYYMCLQLHQLNVFGIQRTVQRDIFL